MNHAKKKRGVPDAMSGTPIRSVCGILCGQQKSAKPYSFKKLQKSKENTRNPKISGVVLSGVDRKDAGAKPCVARVCGLLRLDFPFCNSNPQHLVMTDE